MRSREEKKAAKLARAQQIVDAYDAQFEGPITPLTPETAKDATYNPSWIAILAGCIWWPLGWKQIARQRRGAKYLWDAMTPEQRKAHRHATTNFGGGGGGRDFGVGGGSGGGE